MIHASLLTPDSTVGVVEHPASDRRVHGNPVQTTRVCFSAPAGEFECGWWECEVGAYRLELTAAMHEFFFVIEGRLRIVSEDGTAADCGPGDACVIPAGFKGVVDVIEPVRKYFAFGTQVAAASSSAAE
ncbi:MAG: DUF861 domain-containing protein [Burkholderiales bacterium]|nr:DUF861 domain-containing protein [Burkholderiales bacterium]